MANFNGLVVATKYENCNYRSEILFDTKITIYRLRTVTTEDQIFCTDGDNFVMTREIRILPGDISQPTQCADPKFYVSAKTIYDALLRGVDHCIYADYHQTLHPIAMMAYNHQRTFGGYHYTLHELQTAYRSAQKPLERKIRAYLRQSKDVAALRKTLQELNAAYLSDVDRAKADWQQKSTEQRAQFDRTLADHDISDIERLQFIP